MLNNIIIRLLVYYAAWLLALSGIFHLFPRSSITSPESANASS